MNFFDDHFFHGLCQMNKSRMSMEMTIETNLFYLFHSRNIGQMLQDKRETVHHITVVPTNDPSVLKETEVQLNDDRPSSN